MTCHDCGRPCRYTPCYRCNRNDGRRHAAFEFPVHDRGRGQFSRQATVRRIHALRRRALAGVDLFPERRRD